MAESERRRRRPAVSCSLCRRRKIRCNRETPCSNCVRSKNASCVYEHQEDAQKLPQRQVARRSIEIRRQPSPPGHLRTPSSIASTSTPQNTLPSFSTTSITSSAPSPAKIATSREVNSIKTKIRELEEQLSKVDSTFAQSPVPTLPQASFKSSLGGTFHVHENHLFGKSHGVINSITHKTRTFGQSHWINGAALVRDIVETIEPCVQRDTFDILSNTKRCKQLARAIKSRRAPSWPLQDLSDLPSKAVADDLIDCYLQTIESVYRILHVPSFRRDYEALWTSTAEPNPAFLIQLKLVLAIGATMHDNRFSLRTSAIRWVYEAQTWVSEPRFKSMLGIQYVQVYLLLLLARETADVACELIWISVGTLYRVAIQMGLHRDPSLLPHGTTLMAEMRRRLWNTILEISLQSSLTAGGPPLTSLEDFDTQSPGNFDDEQIMTESPVAKSEDEHTQLSVAIALRKTLPYRLAVTKALNNLGARNTYETTLRLDAELRESYKALRQTLHRCVSNSSPSTSRYAIRMADIIMHRYLSALHIPFFGPAFNETAFAFSRKVVVESSLKIWYAIFPSSYNLNAASGSDDMISSNEDWLARLMICGSGFFRVVAFQATFSLVIELRSQLQEEEGLGPVSARPDLLAVLEGAKSWAFACVEAGETSVKGYLFLCVISAQVRGLLRGIGEDKEPELLAKAAAEAVTRCLPVLEAAADQLQPSETSAERDSGSINQPLGTTDSWDFMMSDSMLDAGNFDPTSWSFGDDMFQEPSFW